MIFGSPEEEIIKMVANYDLIIIGLRDKEHFSDNLVENITERVTNSSKKPVLVVP